MDYAEDQTLHVIRRPVRFIAPCPFYPETPGAALSTSRSHRTSVCLWPGALSHPIEVGRYFDAVERPWSDREARNILFGNVPAFYFGGGRVESKGDSLLERAGVTVTISGTV